MSKQFNNEALTRWLRAIVTALPHGGKRKAADNLGISQSGLSKLLNAPGRTFDEKTIRAVTWMSTSKAEKYPPEQFPVVRAEAVDGILFETRKGPTGDEFVTWRVEE